MWGWRSSRTIVLGTAAATFAVGCLLPVVSTLVTVVPGVADAFVLDARQWRLLANTALLGTGAALLATAIGAPLGFALARAALPYAPILRLALSAPVLLPPYVVALAWTYLASRQGVLAAVLGPDQLAAWIFSLPCAIVVLGLVFYPLVMLATEVALRRVDGRLEEAALLVAAPRRVVWRITMPLVAPSVLASALMVFVLAVSEFGLPGVLRVRVYTTEVFTAFAAFYDPARAARTAVPLLVLCAGVALVAMTLIGDRLISARRATPTPSALLASRTGVITVALAVVLTLSLALPLGVLGREAIGSRSMTAALASSAEAVLNSLRLATLGASVIVGIAVWLGYARARVSGPVAVVVDVVLVVLFAVPSTLIGVGLIGVWNRRGPLGMLYGTEGMLLLASVARLLPIAVLAMAAAVRTVPVSHEEAAAVSGAGWLRTLWQLVLPQVRVAIIATWALVFVLAFGELGVSIVVAPPGETTLPIRIYTIIANTPASTVAVLALLQSTVILTPLVIFSGILARREAS